MCLSQVIKNIGYKVVNSNRKSVIYKFGPYLDGETYTSSKGPGFHIYTSMYSLIGQNGLYLRVEFDGITVQGYEGSEHIIVSKSMEILGKVNPLKLLRYKYAKVYDRCIFYSKGVGCFPFGPFKKIDTLGWQKISDNTYKVY